MPAEISYDLLMGPDMDFVEGSYRLSGNDWQVFVFNRGDVPEPVVKQGRFDSGVTGISVRLPTTMALNQTVVEMFLSQICEVDNWTEVCGPDSMTLR